MPTLAPKVTARPALNLSLYLRDRRVLLVGTGAGADERLSRLDDAGATVERIDEEAWRSGEPPEGHFFLVIGHSADDPLNAEVAQWARDHARPTSDCNLDPWRGSRSCSASAARV